MADAYARRLPPVTCLAPDSVQAFLEGRQPKGLRVANLLRNPPLIWNGQVGRWRTHQSSDCKPRFVTDPWLRSGDEFV